MTQISSREEDRVMVEERTLERPAGMNVVSALLDEYLELRGELDPLEKRMREVRDRLRDLVTEHGHFVDETRGVAVHVEARFRKEYDAERLVAVFPGWLGASSPLWTRTSWRPA